MNYIKKNTFLFILFSSILLPSLSFSHNHISHKQEDTEKYLNDISCNLEEKTQITCYMKDNPDKTYLEMGAGGDSISHIFKCLPESYRGTLIASDLDKEILDAIPNRHPELKNNLLKDSKQKLILMPLDATQMRTIKDESLAGINASAIAHEVVSYIPPRTALSQLFLESARSLEKEGVFIYRDPMSQDDPSKINTLVINTPFANRFAILFLSRFLDRNFSHITNMEGSCAKPDFSYIELVRIITTFKNGSTEALSYQDFLATPTSDFDLSAPISIEAPRRLINELQRHYVLFAKDIYPQAFTSHLALETGNHIAQ